jgi:hypothetical protein
MDKESYLSFFGFYFEFLQVGDDSDLDLMLSIRLLLCSFFDHVLKASSLPEIAAARCLKLRFRWTSVLDSESIEIAVGGLREPLLPFASFF